MCEEGLGASTFWASPALLAVKSTRWYPCPHGDGCDEGLRVDAESGPCHCHYSIFSTPCRWNSLTRPQVVHFQVAIEDNGYYDFYRVNFHYSEGKI